MKIGIMMKLKKNLTNFHYFGVKLKEISMHIQKVGNYLKTLPGKWQKNVLKMLIGCEIFNVNIFKISGSVPKCMTVSKTKFKTFAFLVQALDQFE